MSIETNKALVRRHYEDLVNNYNLPAADEQVAENFIDHGAPLDRANRGPEVAKQAMIALHTAIPDVRVVVDDIVAEGDRVAVRATWKGTFKAPLMGIPAPGKEVTITGMVFWRIANNRLVERWATVDMSGLRSQ